MAGGKDTRKYTETAGRNQVEINQRKFRLAEVIKRIRKGWSRAKLIEWVKEQWDLADSTASKYIKDAYDLLAENADEVIEKSKAIQIERLEDLLVDALKDKDRANSLKALDMLNKIYSLYVEKKEVKLDSTSLKFSFGDEVEEAPEEGSVEDDGEEETDI